MNVALIIDSSAVDVAESDHPERAERTVCIERAVRMAAVPGVEIVLPESATLDQVLLVHAERHVRWIQHTAMEGGGYADADTPVHPGSYELALLAAGGAIKAVDLVLAGKYTAAFSAMRPPGHHASSIAAAGFCLFNNVAIAARHARRAHGTERIMIVDFDAHHGNGTQAIFEDDPSVLYASVHQYPFYPGTGSARETGLAAGRGYTVNVPIPPGVGDQGIIGVFDEVFGPIASRYHPQLILVSAGYDGHWRDPLTMLDVSTVGYATLAERLRTWAEEQCEGRLAFVLEGGYDLSALSSSVLTTAAVLAGQSVDHTIGPAEERRFRPGVESAIATAKEAHPLWFDV